MGSWIGIPSTVSEAGNFSAGGLKSCVLQIIDELSRLNLKEEIKSFNVTLLSVFVFLMNFFRKFIMLYFVA